MKALKRSIVMLAVVALAVGFSSSSYAFHAGGVAECDGCHTMHNSVGGGEMAPEGTTGAQYTANQYLLQGTDQSSTCLICHASNAAGAGSKVVLTTDAALGAVQPANMTPGGDFGWLKLTFAWTGYHGAETSEGRHHGHSVVAADFGLAADSSITLAPGGTYAAEKLACSSCHDPHGRYRNTDPANMSTVATTGKPTMKSGSTGTAATANEAVGVYRILGGSGYKPKSYADATAFTAGPPVAVAPSSYNRSEGLSDTRVAYGQGMSEWCANCHSAMHKDTYVSGTASGTAGLVHPAGNGADLTADIASNYKNYVKSGLMDGTGGGIAGYSSLVPYEIGSADRATVKSFVTTPTDASASSNNVMCLSCHRAHASGWNSMTRWNMDSEYLTAAGEWMGTDATAADAKSAPKAQGRIKAETQRAMYDRLPGQFANYQRSLCNKCHAKD